MRTLGLLLKEREEERLAALEKSKAVAELHARFEALLEPIRRLTSLQYLLATCSMILSVSG